MPKGGIRRKRDIGVIRAFLNWAVQEGKIRLVIDDLNDRQFMVYEIIRERSAKDLPTIYKEVAPLLEDIKDPERQGRKTLEQLLKINLITFNLEVRNKVDTK